MTFVPLPDGEPRFAYGVGRRVGPAVVRNRVRRRLRVAARELSAPGPDGAPGLAPGAYLVTVSPRAVEASYADLRRHLGEACAAATSPASPTRPSPSGVGR